MKWFLAAAFVVSTSIAPVSLYAKGDIVKIVVKGADLAAPIEITDPRIRAFTPWAGPGLRINGVEQTEGFIIDWPRRVAEPPRGLRHYELSFYAKLHVQPEGAKEELVHVVSYDHDPVTGQGYVYLPGTGDQWYGLNASKMLHGGMEGSWFRATRAWEDLVRPLLAKTHWHAEGSPKVAVLGPQRLH